MGNGKAPLVQTGDIEEAEFNISKVVMESGEVVEHEIDAELDDEFLEEFQEDIDARVDTALNAMQDGVAETVEEATEAAFETEYDLSDMAGTTADAAEESESTAQSDTSPGDGEDTDTDDSVATNGDTDSSDDGESQRFNDGWEIVHEERITTTDYPTFAAAMRDRGYTDDDASETWGTLRDDDAIPQEWDDEDEDDDRPPAETVDFDPAEVDEPSGGQSDSNESVDLPAGADLSPGDVVLVANSDEEASNTAVTALQDAIVDEEILAVLTDDAEFDAMLEAILSPLDAPVEVPLTVEWTGDTFERKPLEEAFSEYA